MIDIPMRRYENAVYDHEIIRAILDEILVVHVGMFDKEYPYVFPLNFGYEMSDGRLDIFIHGVREGHKIELFEKDPHVELPH